MTSTITVRLSEKERRELQRYGKISEVVREALRLYLRNRASGRIISRLKELQKITTMRTTIQDDLQLIRTDRER
jgi:Arc/MetJ-type ribon-helix-helix transcriptional regulator